MFGNRPPPTLSELVNLHRSLVANGATMARTGALPPVYDSLMRRAGYEPRQQLTLLEHVIATPRTWRRYGRHSTRHSVQRATAASFDSLSSIDQQAFVHPWQLDVAGIHDVLGATPEARARLVRVDGCIVGFALSGRDGYTGYLQRLSVHPQARRNGVASALVADSLRWAHARRRIRVLVNTHVGNDAALALYRRFGFQPMHDRLTVYERHLP
jgi:ribosomal-protein-alanine N-acetyltransferase